MKVSAEYSSASYVYLFAADLSRVVRRAKLIGLEKIFITCGSSDDTVEAQKLCLLHGTQVVGV